MRTSLLLPLLSLPLAVALAPSARAAVPSDYPVLGQEDEDDGKELPDKRPEVKELIGSLSDQIKERGEKDPEAVQTIDRLLQEFPKSGPKDRSSIVTALSKCFEVRRLELEPDVPDNRLYLAAATALGEMGPESVKVLTKWIGHKKQDDDLQVQRALILSLGKTRDDEGFKTLFRTLQNHQAAIVAAGAEALAQFGSHELETRKKAFEELLKVLMSAKGQMDADVNDLIARERYEVIGAPIITSLSALSGQDIRDPAEWQRWWNKNKREDWDKAAGQ